MSTATTATRRVPMGRIINELEQEVTAMGFAPGSDTFRAAVLLLAGLGRRKHLGDFVRLTGYPRAFVERVMDNCRANGIWQPPSTMTYADWNHPDDQHATTAFLLDIQCALGDLERVPGKTV